MSIDLGQPRPQSDVLGDVLDSREPPPWIQCLSEAEVLELFEDFSAWEERDLEELGSLVGAAQFRLLLELLADREADAL